MNTCKSCEYFKTKDSETFGDCNKKNLFRRYEWTDSFLTGIEKPHTNNVLAYSYEDVSFTVGEDFGCIHHKEIDNGLVE